MWDEYKYYDQHADRQHLKKKMNLLSPPVAIDQIKEVRNGKNTDVLRNQDVAGHYPEECAFSIIYGDNYETMDLIANTPDEANIWVTGLTCLVSGINRKTGGG